MEKFVADVKWLAEQAEDLQKELQSYLDRGMITQIEAHKKMRWFIFQTSLRILNESADKNLPLPDWREMVKENCGG